VLHLKGAFIVQARNGGNIGRVGLLGRLQGKRFARDRLDYNTNIDHFEAYPIV
jgi:hypothetical protein